MEAIGKHYAKRRSQTQKVTDCIIKLYLHEISIIGKTIETERLVVFRGWGRVKQGVSASWVWEFLFGVMKMIWNHLEVMVAQRCECTECH